MDLEAPHVSAFARFSDRLKSSTRRKPSTTHASGPEALHLDARSQESERRRSSVANYAAAIRQIFTPSAAALHQRSSIASLPTELLTQILLYLDFWSLVRCQRVCKHWRSLVPGESPLLAEALYLKPSHNLDMYSSTLSAIELQFLRHPYMLACLGRDGSSSLAGESRSWALTHQTKALIRLSTEIVLHPVLQEFDNYVPWLAARQEFYSFSPDVSGGTMQRKVGEMVDWEEGESWREMLVSMPPVQEIVLSPGWATRQVSGVVLKAKEGSAGITLGELVERMEEWGRRAGTMESVPLE
ncbi:hypothetical protein ACN47E_002725 [Coniothyrium glycines]